MFFVFLIQKRKVYLFTLLFLEYLEFCFPENVFPKTLEEITRTAFFIQSKITSISSVRKI